MSSSHDCARTGAGRRLITMVATGLATFAVAVAALAVLAVPAPAHAESAHAWSSSTVCVESHVSAKWRVRSAIRRWNQLDGGPTFVLEATCPDYNDTVTVRYRNAKHRFTGWTNWYWDATGQLVHADVTVNPRRVKAFASEDRSCQRKYTMTHELGHALGLRHYPRSHAGSVMSYLGWKRHCGGLSAHDIADHARLYPAAPTAEEPVV
jgi:hypothetical protein